MHKYNDAGDEMDIQIKEKEKELAQQARGENHNDDVVLHPQLPPSNIGLVSLFHYYLANTHTNVCVSPTC